MPKLPVVSGLQAVRALERLGFVQVRQRGSHVTMRLGSAGCTIPMHRELKPGTLASVLRQAQVSPDAFRSAILQ